MLSQVNLSFLQMLGTLLLCSIEWTPGEFPQHAGQIPSAERFCLPATLWCILLCVAKKTVSSPDRMGCYLFLDIPLELGTDHPAPSITVLHTEAWLYGSCSCYGF